MHPFWTNSELEEVIGGKYIDSSPPSLPNIFPTSTPPSLPTSPFSPVPNCPGLSAEQLQLFIPRLLSAVHIESLVMGNISKDVGNTQHVCTLQTICTQQPKV